MPQQNRYGHLQLEDSRLWTASPLPGYEIGGRPSITMAINTLLGQLITPRPLQGTNQGAYDAYRMRDRNLDFLAARNNSFATNLFAQQLGGINQSSMAFQLLSPFMTDPDGAVMKALSPLMGGNPVKAQMGLYADFTGQSMGAFGQIRNISLQETNQLMKDMYKNVFNTEKIDDAAIEDYKRNTLSTISKKFGFGSKEAQAFESALGKSGELGIRELERQFGSEDNGKLGNLIERTLEAIKQTTEKTNISEGDKTKEIEDLKRDARSAANEFLENVTDQQARMKMSQAFTKAIEDSEYGAKGFKQDFSTVHEDLIRKLRGVTNFEGRKGEEVARSINFNKTRGFQVEEITSGFASAAEYRLISKGGISQKFEGFTENGIPVMDAAREVFGNDRTGRQLITDIDSILGNSYVDLSDSKQAGELEDLLRNIKATARTQGIAVEEILQLANHGRALASMKPNLRDIGGAEIMKMTTDALTTAGTLTSYMDNDHVRRMGGPVAFAQRQIQGEIQSASESITQRTAALYEYAASQDNEEATKFINDYAAGKTDHDFTIHGFNAFVQSLSDKTNINAFSLHQFATTNREAASLGLRRNPELASIGAKAAVDVFERMVYAQREESGMAVMKFALSGGAISKEEILKKFPELNTESVKAIEAFDKRIKAGETIGIDEISSALRLNDPDQFVDYMVQNAYDEVLREQVDPVYKAFKDQDRLLRDESAKISKDMSKKLGHLNAPITQTLFQQLMNGEVEEGGIARILDPLKNQHPQYDAMQSIIKDINNISQNETVDALVKNYKDVLTKSGSTDVTSDLENVLKVSGGLSYEDIRKYAGKSEDDLKEHIEYLRTDPKADKSKLAALENTSYDQIKRAADTLNVIDPDKQISGDTDIFQFAKKQLVEKLFDVYQAPKIDTLNEKAAENFDKILSGEGFDGVSKEYNESLKKDFGVIKDRLKEFGVFNKEGKFDAVKYEELVNNSSTPEGTKFKDTIEELANEDDDKTTKSIETSSFARFRNIVDVHASAMDEARAEKSKTIAGLTSPEKVNTTTDSIGQLSQILGSNFGKDIVKALNDLKTVIQSATNG